MSLYPTVKERLSFIRISDIDGGENCTASVGDVDTSAISLSPGGRGIGQHLI
jgi:hypothetical protein